MECVEDAISMKGVNMAETCLGNMGAGQKNDDQSY